MAHHITNRRRRYKPGTKSFFWEGLNTSTYIVGALCFLVGSVFFLPSLFKEAWGAWCFIIGSALVANFYRAYRMHRHYAPNGN